MIGPDLPTFTNDRSSEPQSSEAVLDESRTPHAVDGDDLDGTMMPSIPLQVRKNSEDLEPPPEHERESEDNSTAMAAAEEEIDGSEPAAANEDNDDFGDEFDDFEEGAEDDDFGGFDEASIHEDREPSASTESIANQSSSSARLVCSSIANEVSFS